MVAHDGVGERLGDLVVFALHRHLADPGLDHLDLDGAIAGRELLFGQVGLGQQVSTLSVVAAHDLGGLDQAFHVGLLVEQVRQQGLELGFLVERAAAHAKRRRRDPHGVVERSCGRDLLGNCDRGAARRGGGRDLAFLLEQDAGIGARRLLRMGRQRASRGGCRGNPGQLRQVNS